MGPHVGDVIVHMSGPKTDWANKGRIRPHTVIPEMAKNSELRLAGTLVELHDMRPVKSALGIDALFAIYRNGGRFPPALLRPCLGPPFSKRGETPGVLLALLKGGRRYRVARVGRWRAESISSYLWGGGTNQMLDGLGSTMVDRSRKLHMATKW